MLFVIDGVKIVDLQVAAVEWVAAVGHAGSDALESREMLRRSSRADICHNKYLALIRKQWSRFECFGFRH